MRVEHYLTRVEKYQNLLICAIKCSQLKRFRYNLKIFQSINAFCSGKILSLFFAFISYTLRVIGNSNLFIFGQICTFFWSQQKY